MSVTSSFQSSGGNYGSLLIRLICIKVRPEWRNDQSSRRGVRVTGSAFFSNDRSISLRAMVYTPRQIRPRRERCFSRKFVSPRVVSSDENILYDNFAGCPILINELPLHIHIPAISKIIYLFACIYSLYPI